MVKKDIINLYVKNYNMSAVEAEDEVQRFIDVLKYALSTEKKVIFRKFGSFEVRKTKERKIVDPKGRGKIIQAKPRKYVKFKVSKLFAENLLEIE